MCEEEEILRTATIFFVRGDQPVVLPAGRGEHRTPRCLPHGPAAGVSRAGPLRRERSWPFRRQGQDAVLTEKIKAHHERSRSIPASLKGLVSGAERLGC